MTITPRALFGPAAGFLIIIDKIIPHAAAYQYNFIEDSSFERWKETDDFSIQKLNHVLALEAVDKAHLAAVTSLVRTKRWADAAYLMYKESNFLGWASCTRGLIESAGDILDGLLSVSSTIALHHRPISLCLRGKAEDFHNFSELEKMLDHFVLAKWGREKASVLTTKSNADYVKLLSSVMPDALKIYQRLCSITHPSADSISYLFEQNTASNERMRLSIGNDRKTIDGFNSEYPKAIETALMMSCTPALLVLRVLHKFGLHPKLAALKKLDWRTIPAWSRIKENLGK